jgi:hypothetical protein
VVLLQRTPAIMKRSASDEALRTASVTLPCRAAKTHLLRSIHPEASRPISGGSIRQKRYGGQAEASKREYSLKNTVLLFARHSLRTCKSVHQLAIHTAVFPDGTARFRFSALCSGGPNRKSAIRWWPPLRDGNCHHKKSKIRCLLVM